MGLSPHHTAVVPAHVTFGEVGPLCPLSALEPGRRATVSVPGRSSLQLWRSDTLVAPEPGDGQESQRVGWGVLLALQPEGGFLHPLQHGL